MVRIPDRPYAYLARGHSEAYLTGSSEVFQETGRAGRELFALGQALQDKQDHDGLVEAQSQYSRMLPEPADGPETIAGSPSTQLLAFQERHQEAVEAGLARMRESGSSGSAEKAFKIWAKEREKAGMAKAARYGYLRMLSHGQKAHDARVEGIFQGLERNPEFFDDAVKQLEESYILAVGQKIFTPERAGALLGEAHERLKQTAFAALYAQNPTWAMERMDALEFGPEQKTAASSRYEADMAERGALQKVSDDLQLRYLAIQAENADFLASQNGETSSLRSLAESFAALGDGETAEKLSGKAQLYEKNISAIKESGALPLPELAGIIRNLEKGLAVSEKSGRGAGTAQKQELRLRYGIYEERLRALETDPAEAVEREVRTVLEKERSQETTAEELFGALMTGRASAGLFGMRLAAQANNALPWDKRRVFTNAEAVRFREAWHEADAEGRWEMARKLGAYGQYAGAAAREAGLSPSERLVMAQMVGDPAAGQALRTVIAVNGMKTEALPKLENAEHLARVAFDNSHVMRAYLAAADLLPGNPRLREDLDDFSRTLFRLVLLKGGDTASAAATLDGRMRSMTAAQYALLYDPRAFTYADDLRQGLQKTQDGPALELLAAALPLPENKQKEWASHMKNKGVWLNAPDGDGYALFDPDSGLPAQDRQGSLFRLRDRDVRRFQTLARMNHIHPENKA